jgi:eukaryotic-like serine/threonine-protein kinase
MSSVTRTLVTRRQQTGPPPGLLILGRYRLHRPLGAGGFGTVWMARDERLERDVAVKVLARDRIVGGRFEREARAAARLSHPGIVTLYEAAVDDDGAYLVSELVRGSTLSQMLEAGRLSDRDIVEIGIVLCEALSHAHGQGVIHRDVKPSNVLVPDDPASPRQVAKLTDFGVARVIGADTLTRTGDVVGTAAYMAPEQADGREAGAAADLYSLALVLYEALTGVNPIATGPPAQRARRLGAHLPALRRWRRELPGDLGHALDLALRPRPRERGTVDDLHGGLVAAAGQVEDRPGIVDPAWPRRRPRLDTETSADPSGQEPSGAVPADLPASPRWPARVLGAAAAAAATGWLVSRGAPEPPLAPASAALVAAIAVAVLPGVGWLAITLGVGAMFAAEGRPGAAVLVVLCGLLPTLALPRRRTNWTLPALAAGLGVVSLAGAWPSLAGRATGPWNRAWLAATGWIWMLAAGALVGRGLYTRPPGRLPSAWERELGGTIDHVLPRLFAPGLIAPAALWALAAVVLPWIVGRRRTVDVVVITVWSAALASGSITLLRVLHAGVAVRPGAVALGAVAGWIVALAPALFRWRETAPRPAAGAARLA